MQAEYDDLLREFGLKKGLIITLDSSEEIELNGVRTSVMPLFGWLLT